MIIASCKEAKIRYKFSGVWDVKEFTTSYFTDGVLDSTITHQNSGTWLLRDDATSWHNYFEFHHEEFAPLTLSLLANGTGEDISDGNMYWYTDDNNKDRFTLWGSDGGLWEVYYVYTITSKTNNKIKLQWVTPSGGNPQDPFWTEEITLKRI